VKLLVFARRLFFGVLFSCYFLWELTLANLRVAYDVVTPTHYMRPVILALPMDADTDIEITVLANLITLKPGTLSLDVSVDRKVLYVHSMYLEEPHEFKKFERRLLRVFR
jgi:multicomponent Na+:H+ antiporter subunit E